LAGLGSEVKHDGARALARAMTTYVAPQQVMSDCKRFAACGIEDDLMVAKWDGAVGAFEEKYTVAFDDLASWLRTGNRQTEGQVDMEFLLATVLPDLHSLAMEATQCVRKWSNAYIEKHAEELGDCLANIVSLWSVCSSAIVQQGHRRLVPWVLPASGKVQAASQATHVGDEEPNVVVKEELAHNAVKAEPMEVTKKEQEMTHMALPVGVTMEVPPAAADEHQAPTASVIGFKEVSDIKALLADVEAFSVKALEVLQWSVTLQEALRERLGGELASLEGCLLPSVAKQLFSHNSAMVKDIAVYCLAYCYLEGEKVGSKATDLHIFKAMGLTGELMSQLACFGRVQLKLKELIDMQQGGGQGLLFQAPPLVDAMWEMEDLSKGTVDFVQGPGLRMWETTVLSCVNVWLQAVLSSGALSRN
jgi:hypothetical protein